MKYCNSLAVIGLLTCVPLAADDRLPPAVSFEKQDGRLQIVAGSQTIAEYVYQDDQVRRPYFRHLKTLSGIPVTRTHPPVIGTDLDDHPTMHPGLWLAFGDLGRADFWRNKGRVRQVQFLIEPKATSGSGTFAVRNAYEADDQLICTEDCTFTISVQSTGYLISWDSAFHSDRADFWFGDQEEMGLGVRVATPLAVVKGGQILDSQDRQNGAQVWGKQADWCDYSGVRNGARVGVVLMPHPQNFRRSWFHARDYGLLVANPFGQNAFTKGENSEVAVKVGQKFRLRFGVLVYGVPAGETLDIGASYRDYVAN
jgi:hypothetical protein